MRQSFALVCRRNTPCSRSTATGSRNTCRKSRRPSRISSPSKDCFRGPVQPTRQLLPPGNRDVACTPTRRKREPSCRTPQLALVCPHQISAQGCHARRGRLAQPFGQRWRQGQPVAQQRCCPDIHPRHGHRQPGVLSMQGQRRDRPRHIVETCTSDAVPTSASHRLPAPTPAPPARFRTWVPSALLNTACEECRA
jgi:hypothetical protein